MRGGKNNFIKIILQISEIKTLQTDVSSISKEKHIKELKATSKIPQGYGLLCYKTKKRFNVQDLGTFGYKIR